MNADPDAIGETVRLNGQNATIVGVTPRKFDGALSPNPSELFVPITVPATLAPELGNDVLAAAQREGFPVADAACAGGDDRCGRSGAGWDYAAPGQGRPDGSAAGQQGQARRADGGWDARADSARIAIEGAGVLCRAHGDGDSDCVPESGDHGAGAEHGASQRAGHPAGGRCKPLPADPANGHGRDFAFPAGGRGRVCAGVWPGGLDRPCTAAGRVPAAARQIGGLACGVVCPRAGRGLRDRIQHSAGDCRRRRPTWRRR